MDQKMQILLDKINIDKDNYQYFSDAKISKIKIHSKTNAWNVFIEKETLLPLEIYEELEEKKHELDANASEINFIFDIENPNLEAYKEYYSYLLKLLKPDLKVLEIYENSLDIEDDFLILVASNEVEKERLESCLSKINTFYKCLGYKFNIDVIIRKEENILEEIKQELIVETPKKEEKKEVKQETQTSPEKKYHKEPKDPNSVIGRGIKEDPIKIKTLIGEDNNVVVEGFVFGTDYFESSKTDFKIITLKITDYSDSIYCKVFVRDPDEYGRLCKELKAGNWFKIRGYTKNDQFSKEVVLNARESVKIEKEVSVVKDTAEVKRVELHCHTKMSQMDGLADEEQIVKQAMKWGHKAIAITDHNGV